MIMKQINLDENCFGFVCSIEFIFRLKKWGSSDKLWKNEQNEVNNIVEDLTVYNITVTVGYDYEFCRLIIKWQCW